MEFVMRKFVLASAAAALALSACAALAQEGTVSGAAGGAGFVDLVVPDMDFHPVFDRRRASGLQLRHAFHFDEAHAALPDDAERGVIAEVGNMDVRRFRGFDRIDSILDFDFDSVDGNFSHRVLY